MGTEAARLCDYSHEVYLPHRFERLNHIKVARCPAPNQANPLIHKIKVNYDPGEGETQRNPTR